MSNKYYCYSINPTDFWFGSFNRKQLLENAVNSDADHNGSLYDEYGLGYVENGEPVDQERDRQIVFANIESQINELDRVMENFNSSFIKDEWRDEARYCYIPSDYSLVPVAMRKVDGNGTTLVVSPVPLDYLKGQHEDYAHVYAEGLWCKQY